MRIKYFIIILYVVLVGVFGFFYENKNTELKASSMKMNNINIENYYDVDMPRYPNVKETPVIGEQYINNARLQSSYFITDDSPLNISEFYQKYWTAQGLESFKSINPTGGTISVYDYKEKVTKMVTIKQESKHSYRVILSALSDMKMNREFNAFSDIPANKGSYGFISYESEDDNYKASDVSYLNPMSMQKNENFYKKSMIDKGWKLSRINSLPGVKITESLVFIKGNKVAEINLTNNRKSGTIIRLLVKDKSAGLIMRGVQK